MGQGIEGFPIILMRPCYVYPGWGNERTKQRLSMCLFNKAGQQLLFATDTDISVKETDWITYDDETKAD